MSYFSLKYLIIFLLTIVVVYIFTPKKLRNLLLLLASYALFIKVSKKLVVFLLLSTLSIYFSALLMNKLDLKRNKEIEKVSKEEKKIIKEKYKSKKRIILILTILFNVAFLFYFKYLNFFKEIINIIFSSDLKILKIIAPMGISFYTLRALSYVIDVYNEKEEAERNIIKIMLYLSFFPIILEGPIASYADVKNEFDKKSSVTYHNFCFGCQRILYGLFKKLVIADRLNQFVKIIFESYMDYSGSTIFLGAIFYTILLYMEFSGTMDVVCGSAEIFGIKLPENFRQPFFSKNISEFWSRWHITLGLWFKNYIFYPVSLSKPVKKLSTFLRNKVSVRFSSLTMGAIALFAVWSLNGLWHGAGFTYMLFGYYHFILILLGNIFEPLIVKGCEKLKISRNTKIYKFLQIIKTSILVFIGELIFRAKNLTVAFGMLKRIFLNFNITNTNFVLGLDIKDYIVLVFALIIVLVISILKEKNVNVREELSKKHIVIRWVIYYALIIGIIIFGAYGPGYAPVEPIYADF